MPRKHRKKKHYSTHNPKYNRYNEKTRKQQKFEAQVARKRKNKQEMIASRQPELIETQKVFDETLKKQAEKFKESYVNQWNKSAKDVSKIDDKLKQLLEIQKQRNVPEETKKKFNESVDQHKDEMQEDVQKEYEKDIHGFVDNTDIDIIENAVKSIPFAQRGRYYDPEKFRENIKDRLINTTTGLLSAIEQNRLFRTIESRISRLDAHLDEQIKLETELLERDRKAKEIKSDLDKAINKADPLNEIDVFGSLHKSLFESNQESKSSPQEKGDKKTLLEKFKEERIAEILKIKQELNKKRTELQEELKEVEKQIEIFSKEKEDFNQRMESIQKEKMTYIEKCNELLAKNDKLIKDFDNNERIKDLKSSYNYGLQMDKEEMEERSNAILEEIQAYRLKIYELSEQEDKEVNEMNKKIENVQHVKNNYGNKYRLLKNDLTKLEEDYDIYLENSKAIEYQIDDLNHHDKESLTTKRRAIYKERQRKIARNREESSYKAPSLKDKFYHSMYNTLEQTTNKINKLKMNILKDLKSGDQPIDIGSNNIVARVYGDVLLEELKDALRNYAKKESGKYSIKENSAFAESVIEKLEKTKNSGKEEDFINEYLMAKAMLDTCKSTNSSLKEGFENIENDLFKPKSGGLFSSLFGSKNKHDDDQTNCMKLMKKEFNIEKRVFSKSPKSSSGWFSNFSLKNIFRSGSKEKNSKSLLPISQSTRIDKESELITVKLKGPSNPVNNSKDINLYRELKIKDAENPALLVENQQQGQINHKLSFSHSAQKTLKQEIQHKEVELSNLTNPTGK